MVLVGWGAVGGAGARAGEESQGEDLGVSARVKDGGSGAAMGYGGICNSP